MEDEKDPNILKEPQQDFEKTVLSAMATRLMFLQSLTLKTPVQLSLWPATTLDEVLNRGERHFLLCLSRSEILVSVTAEKKADILHAFSI